MTNEERMTVYTKVFQFVIDNRLGQVPIPFQAMSRCLGVKLVPLSEICRKTGLEEEDIFQIWGNSDGCVSNYVNPTGWMHLRIAYNDRKPEGRIRFTVMEEFSHIILGHVADPDFNVFRQSYEEEKYLQYDEEARMASGLLICPPKLYYSHPERMSCQELQRICRLTGQCAAARKKILDGYESEIIGHPLYSQLPEPYFDATAESAYSVPLSPYGESQDKIGEPVNFIF